MEKRYDQSVKHQLNWALGALAAGVVVAALVRKKVPVFTNINYGKPLVLEPSFAETLPIAKSRVRVLLGALITRLRAHNTVMVAASLSYYAMLAIFPAAIAVVSIYGLVFSPTDIQDQLKYLTPSLPVDAIKVIESQLDSIVDASSTGLRAATILGVVVALWSASAGTKGLINGINSAYGEQETRSFAMLRSVALVITIGMIFFASAVLTLVTFLPGLLNGVGLGSEWERTVAVIRWPALPLFLVLSLGLLYKVAPNRPARTVPFLTIGGTVATTLWLIATVGLSIYANALDSFNKIYGALGGVVVLMLWFFLSGLMFLLGAELNGELEMRRSQTKPLHSTPLQQASLGE